MKIGGVLLLLALLTGAGMAWADEAANPFGPPPVTADAVNQAFGVPLWNGETPLWDEEAGVVAARLGCPPESKTSTQSSFRLYAKETMRLFGARPYSVALYGQDGKTDRLSIVFANPGDFDFKNATQKDFDAAVKSDADTIAKALTDLLGSPSYLNFGTGALQEKMRRWDWNGHAFLLASPQQQYVVLRILPAAVADKFGQADNLSNGELRDLLASRVQHRDNGDVVIGDIPMVDQGPKGYCVPATWERYLRYQTIPADMYVLAMVGGTQQGGGTVIADMVAAADQLVRSRGLQIVAEPAQLTVAQIARNIDQGLPMMWGCYCPRDLEKKFTLRSLARKKVTDWADYTAKLQADREAAPAYRTLDSEGHMRMIIGYNAQTDEIAISDSWGEAAAERWITPEEARVITQENLYVIRW